MNDNDKYRIVYPLIGDVEIEPVGIHITVTAGEPVGSVIFDIDQPVDLQAKYDRSPPDCEDD